ncbi:MAG: hypothetical protein JW941_05185 [Candidatus Coatesbacteria bacterium]|nr:hypothetical protein [Candidatus Coatesbacteria bacterium]
MKNNKCAVGYAEEDSGVLASLMLQSGLSEWGEWSEKPSSLIMNSATTSGDISQSGGEAHLDCLLSVRPRTSECSFEVSVNRSPDLPEIYERPENAVLEHLSQHPSIIGLLARAASKTVQYFGSDIRLALELIHDPEDSGAGPTLYVVIGTELPWEESLKALRRFDNEWWLEASQGLDTPLCITT